VYCTLHRIFTVYCTLHCTFTVYCTLHRTFTVYCTLHCTFTVYCTLHRTFTVYCTLHRTFTVYCTLHCIFTVYCTLHCTFTVYCTLHCTFTVYFLSLSYVWKWGILTFYPNPQETIEQLKIQYLYCTVSCTVSRDDRTTYIMLAIKALHKQWKTCYCFTFCNENHTYVPLHKL
jgi:hypothetical protein